jgi:hypothetical protein
MSIFASLLSKLIIATFLLSCPQHYDAWGRYYDPFASRDSPRASCSVSSIAKNWSSTSYKMGASTINRDDDNAYIDKDKEKADEHLLEVVLGGAESAGDHGLMYSVFIVDVATLKIPQDDVMEVVGQVVTELGALNTSMLSQARDLWADGGQGMCLLHTDDDKLNVGVIRGQAWSADLPLQLATSKCAFEVTDRTDNDHFTDEDGGKAARNHSTSSMFGDSSKANSKAYQLAYSVRPLPGLFSRTKLVVVMPQFAILNCMEEPLEVRQHGADELMFIEPFACRAWHKARAQFETKVHLRSASSSWSFGCVNINELGSSVLLLPSKDWFEGSSNHDAVVVQVEVHRSHAACTYE